MTAIPLIPNDRARRIFLDHHALCEQPTNRDVPGLIHRLGFVQVDSINTVARAHDMILFSRGTSYRPKHLQNPLEKDRHLFEHWTHDASIIPVDFFPHWKLKFERDRVRLRARWDEWRRKGFDAKFEEVLTQIANHGPCCSADVGAGEKRSSGGWWDWHPSKTALEYQWRTGALSVARREGFRKYYDLTEKVIPPKIVSIMPETHETIEWACSAALDRLGFATSGEIAAFWDLITPAEAREWCATALAKGRVIEVDIGMAGDEKPRRSFAWPDILDRDTPEPPNRVRILSPFDPALRDRKRAQRLFGFHYRIEIFVPAPKRTYGYYVFPVLEGDRLIGRIDMKCDRNSGTMNVRAFWPEQKIALGKGRIARLESELDRVARFAGSDRIVFADDWLRSPATH